MYDTNTAIVKFADATELRLADLPDHRVDLLKALATQRRGRLKSFPRRTDDLRGNMRARFNGQAFVTLAAIGHIASLEAACSQILENGWVGSVEGLGAVGRLVADGEHDDLDPLVTLCVPGGWESLGRTGSGADTPIDVQTRCSIAAAADDHTAADPAWLARFNPAETNCTHASPSKPTESIAGPVSIPMPATQKPTATMDEAVIEGEADDIQADAMTTLASILTRPIPPRRPVFGAMVERGVASLLAANPGTGKTMLSIQVVCAVAMGRNWAGFDVPAAGPVIYLNAEDSGHEVSRRFEGARVSGLLDANAAQHIYIIDRADQQRLLTKSGGEIQVTRFGKWLLKTAAIIKPALIVVDPMAMTHCLDENSNADMAALTSYFASLAAAGDAGVLVVHHAGKDTKGGLTVARGASSIAASVRSMWHLSSGTDADRDDLAVQLACVKSNHHPVGSARSFRRSQVVLDNGDTVGLLRPVGSAVGRSDR